jgi:hypothetical protein
VRWLLLAAVLLAVSASVSGVGSISNETDPPGPPTSFSFDLIEDCDDFLNPQAWSDVSAATGGNHSTAVSTRFSLAAAECSRQLGEAANAAATGLGINNAAAQERLLQVTQTE